MLLSVTSCPARQLTGLLRQCWAGSLEGHTHPWWPPTVLSSAGEGAALLTPELLPFPPRVCRVSLGGAQQSCLSSCL